MSMFGQDDLDDEELDDPGLHDVYKEMRKLRREIKELKELVMSEQSSIDAVTAALATLQTQLETADTNIQAEIAALQAANPAADFTKLNAEVAALAPLGAALADIAPTPAPPVTATQAFDPSSGLPLYTYVGFPPVPGDPWVAATDVTGPNGQVLYTNTGDAPSVAPAFVDASWPAFTGTTTPVAS
jgi:hypothetical protein